MKERRKERKKERKKERERERKKERKKEGGREGKKERKRREGKKEREREKERKEKNPPSFPIWIPFISFTSVIAVAKTSNTMLNRNGDSGHPCLVPDFRGKAFTFLPLSMMIPVGLS